jgi:hypothetical protein
MRARAAAILVVLAPLAAEAVTFPVRLSASRRYLEDQAGVPFAILGRTGWFVISQPDTGTGYKTFVDDTAAKGYTAIELHVLDHDPRGQNPPFAGNGALPFTKTLGGAAWSGALTYTNIASEAPDLTMPNEPFWAYVDAFLAYCESKGILVFMFPAYVGYAGGDQGWMQELVANGTSNARQYGASIANRYKAQKNLVWMMGGDMGTGGLPFSAAQTAVEQALIDGLKSVPGQQSTNFSAEWNSESICTDQPAFGASCTLNGAYSWSGDVSNQARRAYARTPVLPAFLLEEPYDQEGPDGNGVNGSATQPVRRFQWWGVLSGIAGYIAGNGYVWPFKSGWETHLSTQGAQDMGRLNAFLGSIPWWTLVPSGLNGMKTLITAGGSSQSAADYVAAAASPDGALLVAYAPPAHTGSITVEMTAMSGNTRARWFNPATAAYTLISASLPNTGTQVFTPSGNNGSGFPDWVLVLDTTGSGSPADAGVDAGTGVDAGADAGGIGGTDAGLKAEGCSCRQASPSFSWLALFAAAGALGGRRRGLRQRD